MLFNMIRHGLCSGDVVNCKRDRGSIFNSLLPISLAIKEPDIFHALSADADMENLSFTCIKVHESANGGGKQLIR